MTVTTPINRINVTSQVNKLFWNHKLSFIRHQLSLYVFPFFFYQFYNHLQTPKSNQNSYTPSIVVRYKLIVYLILSIQWCTRDEEHEKIHTSLWIHFLSLSIAALRKSYHHLYADCECATSRKMYSHISLAKIPWATLDCLLYKVLVWIMQTPKERWDHVVWRKEEEVEGLG